MGLQIPQQVLDQIRMSERELRIEIAVHLYDIGRFTLGQARSFAEIDQITLQQEMKKREIHVKYTLADLAEDLTSLEELDQLR